VGTKVPEDSSVERHAGSISVRGREHAA
jgi:hypothetical protein